MSLLSGFITAIFYNWHMNKVIIINLKPKINKSYPGVPTDATMVRPEDKLQQCKMAKIDQI